LLHLVEAVADLLRDGVAGLLHHQADLRGASPVERGPNGSLSRSVDSRVIMKTVSRRSRRCERPHAIFMKALSLTRRDGPDVSQRLKLEKETTHVIVRWTRVVLK